MSKAKTARRRGLAVVAVMTLGLVVPFAATLAVLTFRSAASAEAPQSSKSRRVVIQVSSDDPIVMKHAISNSLNLLKASAESHEPVAIEIVAYGAGIHIFRSDTSPVKDLVQFLRSTNPEVALSICGNSKLIMESKEQRPLPLIDGVRIVPYGVARIVELQEAGWSYIRP